MVLEMNVDVFTRSVTEIILDPERKNRLRLMPELNDQGVSTKQLAELFNLLKIPTPRVTLYFAKLSEVLIELPRM
jgi:hypothetical protein